MIKRLFPFVLAGLALAGAPGCDLLDATGTDNPNLTEENVLKTPKPMAGWVRGLDRQAALAFNEVVINAELTSDNYVNTNTYFDQNLDALTILTVSASLQEALFAVSDLRASAVYGRTVVAGADAAHTADQLAEVYFYEALAHTLLGELFRLAPAEGGGVPVGGEAHFALARTALGEALQRSTDEARKTGYRILLARVLRNLGDRAGAAEAAAAALAADPAYLRLVAFDAVNGPANRMQIATFDRGDFDDLQPLPRLDFLDPKFSGSGATAAGIPLAKAEEAHLILAEAALAEDRLADARARMHALLDLVAARPVRTFSDAAEDRTQQNPGSRPNTAAWKVQASPDDPLRDGLVAGRKDADVTIPTVSGTSVTPAMVDAATTVDAAVELLYLLRQEVFFAEGRRMADLGVKWVLPERELLGNPNAVEGEATTPLIPPFLQPLAAELDAFRVDAPARTATVLHNLNRVIARNRTSDLVAPFF